jgi:geranylgeranyl diphosphate synthase type I
MEIYEKIKNYAEFFNKQIIEFLSNIEPEILRNASLHIIKSGGKRLRPFILSKVAEYYGVSIQDSIPAAIAVELIHNFSLIHDDIMDNDQFRHGVKTVHVEYGIPYAILAGDTLFSLAFNSLLLLRKKFTEKIVRKVIQELAKATYRLSIGQGYDMYLPSTELFNYKLYYKTVINKTASLYEASCVIGAILGKANYEDIKNIRMFARNSGLAFQIYDDILGVFGDEKITGKPVGNDIREGKKTLIVIYAIKNSNKNEREKILKVLGNKNASEEEIKKVIELLKEINSYDFALKKAMYYNEKAKKYAEKLPKELAKFLSEFSDFLIQRRF